VDLLQQAVAAIEEAISLYRELGLQADLAMSLNNASNRYNALSELEETCAGRVELLQQAATAIEEAISLYRLLDLQSDLALSLNNTSVFYSDLAGLEKTRTGRVGLLQQSVTAAEEAIRIRRLLGLRADLAMSLNNVSGCYSDLAGLEETRAGRVDLLQQAVAAIEEATSLYHALDLQADLAMSLNNASVFYNDLAGLEETRAGRMELLQQAVVAIEKAVSLYRELGLQAEVASSLNNASNRYSALSELDETRAGQVDLLRQAVVAIEEAIRIRRKLGLQADLAISLNNASNCYNALAGLEEIPAGRVDLLRQAVVTIEEAVEIFRSQGVIFHLLVGLNNAIRLHLELAQFTGELNKEHVLDMCREGERICDLMQEGKHLTFFCQVRQQLESQE
jgi:tetratricopeptide (TPR) repeat protein